MPQSISGTRVLIVEDRDDVQAIVRMMLTRLGCAVESVTSAEAAIDVLGRPGDATDLVFSDIRLAGPMTGLDLARVIKERWPSVQVVLTSGSMATKIARAEARHEGYSVLAKPYRSEELREAIRAGLDPRSAS